MAYTPQNKKVRVGNVSAGLLILVAVIMDGLQFLFSFFHMLPWIGNAIAFVVTLVIGLVASGMFWLFFKMIDPSIEYFGGRQAAVKLVAAFGTIVAEVIPLINALPAITAGVITMIIALRIEDTIGDLERVEGIAANRRQELQNVQTPEEQKRILAKQAVEKRRLALAVATPQQYEEAGEEEIQAEMAHPRGDEKTELHRRLERVRAVSSPPLEGVDASMYGKTKEKGVQKYEKWQQRKVDGIEIPGVGSVPGLEKLRGQPYIPPKKKQPEGDPLDPLSENAR